MMEVILSNLLTLRLRALEVEMKHKNGKKDQLTESRGFAKVAEGNDLKPKAKA